MADLRQSYTLSDSGNYLLASEIISMLNELDSSVILHGTAKGEVNEKGELVSFTVEVEEVR